MIHLVSFSGGRTSAYLVHLMEGRRKGLGWDVRYVFMDTGAEHPKTYDFIRNLIRHWGIKLTCLRVVVNPELGEGNSYREVDPGDLHHDLEPWKACTSKYGNPSVSTPYCTKEMKTRPLGKWINDHLKGEVTQWLGMRVDEPRRLKTRDGYSYLADISDFTKEDILDWWEDQPFDLDIPEWLGNCVFCVKKNHKKIRLAQMDEPQRARRFARVIASDRVRVRNEHHLLMYRGGRSFQDVEKLFNGVSRDEILIRMGYEVDSGSCSESCEAYSDE
jgi:hypothetical protein